jgi:hypothetical protein
MEHAMPIDFATLKVIWWLLLGLVLALVPRARAHMTLSCAARSVWPPSSGRWA